MGEYAKNIGVEGDPEPQGYEPVAPRSGLSVILYGCPECGAIWNADDLHDGNCPRRAAS